MNGNLEVLIIGAGFSGLLAAHHLRARGIDDVKIVEAGADFGGTWYWNRYPGAQCDIESYCYLPLLEETAYIPKEKYSYAPEIHEHSRRIARQYDLYSSATFQTRVTSAIWDVADKRWVVSTDRGDNLRARFVIAAIGQASRPKLPGIAGIEDFEGHSFHTSRWDYAYTGGDHNGGLTGLADKRVAIIGTGATAVQCAPYVAAHAEHLYVFQRTPSSVDRRGNKPTEPEWVETLKPGWQRRRRENFNDVMRGKPVEEDLVCDGWTETFRELLRLESGHLPPLESLDDPAVLLEIADHQKMNRIRARIDAMVDDRDVAETLKPWYRQFCKRPTFNDEYLPMFNRPNVTLVDVSDQPGIERLTSRSILANGNEHPVDCVIYATGFEISTAPHRRLDFVVRGEGGHSLLEHWSTGVRTLHGHSTHGFPNWFHIGYGQNGFSFNFTSMADEQAAHVAYIIHEVGARAARTVQPTVAAQESWFDAIRNHSIMDPAFLESCTPGYYNSEGNATEAVGSLLGDAYGRGVNAFNTLLARWRANGDLAGLELGG